MSVQFGRWNFDGKPVEQDYLEKVQQLLLRYGPDDRGSYSSGAISMLYCAFHTTKESRSETQPHIMASGAIITWDGRLDNRADLIEQLGGDVTSRSTDVSIVAAAYERWEGGCFAQLIGDWALAVWNPRTRSLTLAKDPIGVRHLYYSLDDSQIAWSTMLDPLVLCSGKPLTLCEEYVAGWLSFFPAPRLTPYAEVHSVPPCSSVLIQPGKHAVSKYWDFDPGRRIRYRTDGEYEQHFRWAFGKAVRRRLRSDAPVLAELSGGMDSSSIVCMADRIIAEGAAETLRLDTVSYYDDSDPNWNERPYFNKVEEKRGRQGCHINVSGSQQSTFEINNDQFIATPSCGHTGASDAIHQFAAWLEEGGNRVILSGTGGDEVTGGVPTPIPELQDLLICGNLRTLSHQLKLWALSKRQPWFYLLLEAVRGFFPPVLVGISQSKRPAPWLTKAFIRRNRSALQGYQSRLTLLGSLPTFQENTSTLRALQRQLACEPIYSQPLYEKSYPYLDRDFLQFMYSVPREQVVRPGQRRSLMRRALLGIVPDEILNRKRKAYVSRAPLATLSTQWPTLNTMLCSSLNILDDRRFVDAIHTLQNGAAMPIVSLIRTVGLELWLRALAGSGSVNLRAHSIDDYRNNEPNHVCTTVSRGVAAPVASAANSDDSIRPNERR